MSSPPWICPYCGAENYSDSECMVMRPHCRNCDMHHITPERLKLRREKNLNELRGQLTDLRSAYSNLTDQRASLLGDVEGLDREIYGIKQDAKLIIDEVVKWKNLKIYLSVPDQVERAERAKKDPCQRGLELAGDKS